MSNKQGKIFNPTEKQFFSIVLECIPETTARTYYNFRKIYLMNHEEAIKATINICPSITTDRGTRLAIAKEIL